MHQYSYSNSRVLITVFLYLSAFVHKGITITLQISFYTVLFFPYLIAFLNSLTGISSYAKCFCSTNCALNKVLLQFVVSGGHLRLYTCQVRYPGLLFSAFSTWPLLRTVNKGNRQFDGLPFPQNHVRSVSFIVWAVLQ